MGSARARLHLENVETNDFSTEQKISTISWTLTLPAPLLYGIQKDLQEQLQRGLSYRMFH